MGKATLTASEMEAEKELLSDIAVRLDYVLKERDWTVYKLINESHVSKNSVYNAYYGRNGIQINTLFRICKTLGLSLEEFFSYQESEAIHLSEEERIDIMNRRKLDEGSRQRLSAYIQGLVDAQENTGKKS